MLSSPNKTYIYNKKYKYKTIGIDIDEVLLNFMEQFVAFHNNKYGTTYTREKFFSYDFRKVTGLSFQQTVEDQYEFFKSDYFKAIRPVEGAQEAVNILKDQYRLVVPTSRREIIRETTIECLDKFFPGAFSEIMFGNHYELDGTSMSKPDMCKKMNVDLLIDDSLKYVLECAKKQIDSILFNCPWNQSSEDLQLSIARTPDWQEALYLLNKNIIDKNLPQGIAKVTGDNNWKSLLQILSKK